MMVPFDGSGGVPPPSAVQGHPAAAGMTQGMSGMGPPPPGAVGVPPGGAMGSMVAHMVGPYGHRNSLGGGPQGGPPPPYGMPPPSPARQGSFTGSMPPPANHQQPPYGQPHQGGPPPHPHLHSPHQTSRQTVAPPPSHLAPQVQQQHPMHPQGGGHMQGYPRHHSMTHQSAMPPMPGGGPAVGMAPVAHHPHHLHHQQQLDMMGSGSQGSHSTRLAGVPPPPGPNGGGGPPPSASASAGGGGMGGSWQSDNDTPHRREMIQQIVKLLKKDKGGTPESMAKLPQMAKQLEVSLYRNAPSFDHYRDLSTLKKRLQHIAAEVQRKARGVDDRGRYEGGSGGSSSRGGGGGPSSSQLPPPMGHQQHQPQSMSMRGTDGAGGTSPYMGSSSNRGMMMDDPMRLQQQQQLLGPYGGSRGVPEGRISQNRHSSSQSSNAHDSSSSSRNDPEWKQRIRHKQQRLLLLHHSAKCPYEEGTCPVTQHCADMKRLWKHMEGCKDNNCRVPHCFSSRAILSHYRKCKDPSCPACQPVRQTVRKAKASGGGGGYPPSRQQPGGGTGSQMMGTSSMRGQAPSHHLHQQMSVQAPPHQHQEYGSDSLMPTGSFQSTSSSVGSSSFQQSRNTSMPPPGSNGNGGMRQSSQRRGSASNGYSQFQQPLGADEMNPDADNLTRVESITLPPQPSGRQDSSEWQKIRHKQQRLLLLRHASRCQFEAGKCPVTPHCANMKKLWEHIAHCKDQQCTVQHCLSSRVVLSHYRRCKDVDCPACGPVRETIRKSHEKEREREDRRRRQGGMPGPPARLSDGASADGGFGEEPSDSYPPEQKRPRYEPQQHLPPGPTSSFDAPVDEPQVSEALPERPSSDMAQPLSEPSGGASTNEGSEKDVPSKGAADLSLLQSFAVSQLQTHLKSLDRKTQLPPTKLKTKCLDVMKGLQTHQHGWVFNCPVDPVELGLPDYFDIIKKPMDLGTIQKKLENGAYHAIEEFQADVFLTFDNAMTYNEDGSVVFDMAKELRVKFEADLQNLNEQLEAEDLERRQNDRACNLCGCEKLLFEPPVYFCNGMNCQSQRIRRNSHFYIGGNNQYFWCTPCFNELDDKIPIDLVDMSVMKADLKKKKNDEVHEESWVQCDTCQRWVHQICGLFNGRQNTQQHSEYCCPRCLCEKQQSGRVTPTSRPPGAADLPRTMLSEWIERHIMKRVERQKRQLAEEKAAADGMSLEQATRLMDSGPIHVRQVTSMDRKLEVRDLMRKRYAHKNYPEEFPFRCKCVVVFQEIDGVDTVLFALYLYEHGEDNPPPNQRCVYISYLDSVHFMRPRKIRTFVYHEILIAYLDYARRRGFSTVHIWACPPLKGDDYIFYAKPEDQKTPRDARLRQWYIDMLVEAQKRNIVGKLTNMYDLYFANESLDATAVPYLEGDYFPGEAENIIKMIEEGGGKKGAAGGKKKKNSNKNKGGAGTRSSGMDEMALLEAGCFSGMRSLKDLDRDQVMLKLGETIMPMKDSFIVAFLNWSGAKEEDMVVPPEIERARIEYAAKEGMNDITGSKRDSLGNPRDALSLVGKDGQPIKVINDDAEDLDCEFLNNRQAFLNLCRGNHYQFDELRRSKHTSMMVLWHLHNRDAPKFVQQCVSCNREILSGVRYHCNTCPEYDLCQDCYKDSSTNRGACNHKLQAIAVDSESAQERSGLSEEERMQRQRNLMLHIQLIEHAARCTSKTCNSNNCVKMKNYLSHSRTCRVKATGGCKICKRIWTLLRIHAQKCKDRNCPIPQCIAIREKMRQLQKQQQAMDDRRRLEMNRHMRFSITGGAAGQGG